MEKIFLKLLSWIPKKLQSISSFILIFLFIIGGGIYYGVLPNFLKKEQKIEEKCSHVSISGKLLDQNNKDISALAVNIEGMNMNVDNTAQGIFTLKGVKIPLDSLISFQVQLKDTTYFVKGFDLGNRFKYPVNNCKIDVGIVRLVIKKKSPIIGKTKQYSTSKYTVNIKGENNGKIIQGDKIIIVE